MICEICEKDVLRVDGHHLSYEPEKIMMLCKRCHLLLHRLNNLDREKLLFVLTIIDIYGQNWKNGKEQYEKSNYRKRYMREFYLKNKEKIQERDKKRYHENKEKKVVV